MVNLVGTKISFSVFADFKEAGLKYALIKETEKVRSRGEEGWATQRNTKEQKRKKQERKTWGITWDYNRNKRRRERKKKVTFTTLLVFNLHCYSSKLEKGRHKGLLTALENKLCWQTVKGNHQSLFGLLLVVLPAAPQITQTTRPHQKDCKSGILRPIVIYEIRCWPLLATLIIMAAK